MSQQANLVLLLKQKGTGKTMSKSLSIAQCDELSTYYLIQNVLLQQKQLF